MAKQWFVAPWWFSASRVLSVCGCAAVMCLLAACGGSAASPPAGPSTGSAPPSLAVDFDGRGSGVGAAAESMVATARVDLIVARSGPSVDADEVARLANPRPNGVPLVFLVDGAADGEWIEVLLPIRPNGTTGWVPADSVQLARNVYRVEIDTGEHRLLAFVGDHVLVDTEVAIGTGETPTPIGQFFLTELLKPIDTSGPYGTRAFGLSGYSETLRSFNGGDGVIGIHGTNDPASLGTDVSHGCIRVHNDIIEEMAAVLPLGTPVVITG